MTPEERARAVFSEHDFLWRHGERERQIELVAKAIKGAESAERERVAQLVESWRHHHDNYAEVMARRIRENERGPN